MLGYKGVSKNYLTVLVDSQIPDLYNTIQKIKIKAFEQGKLIAEFLDV